MAHTAQHQQQHHGQLESSRVVVRVLRNETRALKAIIIEKEHRFVRSFVRSIRIVYSRELVLWMMVIIKPIARNTVGPGGLESQRQQQQQQQQTAHSLGVHGNVYISIYYWEIAREGGK